MADLFVLSVRAFQGLTNICMNALHRRRSHCIHCKGKQGPCTCTFGCATKRRNNCSPFHEILCDNCGDSGISGISGISGDRFKCRQCNDFDLCSGCYIGGAHDLNHPFVKLERVGVPPIFVPPRSGAPTPENINSETSNLPKSVFDPNTAVPQSTPAPQPELNSHADGMESMKVFNNGIDSFLHGYEQMMTQIEVNEMQQNTMDILLQTYLQQELVTAE